MNSVSCRLVMSSAAFCFDQPAYTAARNAVKTSNTDFIRLLNCESCHWQANPHRLLPLKTSSLGTFGILREVCLGYLQCFMCMIIYFVCVVHNISCLMKHYVPLCNEFVGSLLMLYFELMFFNVLCFFEVTFVESLKGPKRETCFLLQLLCHSFCIKV